MKPGGPPRPFASRLLNWWDDHGRKDLPWQHPRTPYRVWVSEIMLQQTQVSTVIPYFQRWMLDFPDIDSLAAASLDEVLAHWSGLGYYARARNLHKAAKLSVENHDGGLPVDAEALVNLPGIGQSTANAIVSQATNRPAAILDGNVRRVLARHALVEGWSGKAAVRKKLWQEAENRLPESRGADYTQAIMDLGATLCTRINPDCERCPVAADCQALAQHRTADLPEPKPKTRISEQTLRLAILHNGAEVLLQKRPPTGIWGGLWCLPELEAIEVDRSKMQELAPVHHRLSHVRMTIRPFLGERLHLSAARSVKCSPQEQWISLERRTSLGLPKPIADLLGQLASGELE